MDWNAFLNVVARRADTETQKIDASITRRVVRVAFDVFLDLDTHAKVDVMAGARAARARREKG